MIRNRALKRSLSDFKLHPWLHVTSIFTVTLALLILGGFFLCYRNFERLAEKTNPTVTGTAYLKDGLTETEIATLKARILAVPNVLKVTFKSRASVVDEIQTLLGNGSPSDTIPGGDLFPDVFELEMRRDISAETMNEVRAALGKYGEITELDFSEDWLGQYKKIRQFLNLFGIFLMVGVVVGCSFIIANFMGMRHQSRREEIDIVRLIGAQDQFIFTPFLWEGIIEGVTGALLALIGLLVVRSLLSTLISVHWSSLLGVTTWLYLSVGQVFLVFTIGIAMALFGSITVFLRFQERSSQ